VVIRDANKWFVKVQSRWYDHLGDAMISEALAIRDGLGLVLAQEEGLERIIVESDNLAGASRSSLATIWFDVQELKKNLLNVPLFMLIGKQMELHIVVRNLQIRLIMSLPR
jgi:hypothetical protein